MALNEIKMEETCANNISYINGYNMHFKCRNSKGGGVAILVKETLIIEELKIPEEFKEEIIGIFIKLEGK